MIKSEVYLLIADSGSTKVDWVLLDMGNGTRTRFSTLGINGVTSTREQIEITLEELKNQLSKWSPSFDFESIREIYFYGAGCATQDICEKIAESLRNAINKKSRTEVNSDLLGAARSLFGLEGGIACILGTGSNSCLYRNGEIIENIPSLGYVLGDEGSGSALGKRLVKEIFRGNAPSELSLAFRNHFNIDLKGLLTKVYKEPGANVFLASLVPFLKRNIEDLFVRNLIKTEFKHFMDNTVKRYDSAKDYNLGFVGSIACEFKDLLKETAEEEGFIISKIIRKPIDGIIDFHFMSNKI